MPGFDKMQKLNPDDLKRISGGTWDYDTISDEERAEMDKIFDDLWEPSTHKEAGEQLDRFIARMEAKYGANEPLR